MLVKTDGYLCEQHVPIQPCKTPRAILFILSSNGAPKEQKKIIGSAAHDTNSISLLHLLSL